VGGKGKSRIGREIRDRERGKRKVPGTEGGNNLAKGIEEKQTFQNGGSGKKVSIRIGFEKRRVYKVA